MKAKICCIYGILLWLVPITLNGYLIVVSPHLISGFYMIETETLILLAVFVAGTAVLGYILMREVSGNKKYQKIIKFLFLVFLCITYIISAFCFIFCRTHDIFMSVNLIPLEKIIFAGYEILCMGDNMWFAASYILYHLIIFIPLGIILYYTFLKCRYFKNNIILILSISIIVECIVFFTGKDSFNIDSIILSVFGGILAYLFCEKISEIRERKEI